jgi:hypothetical protein
MGQGQMGRGRGTGTTGVRGYGVRGYGYGYRVLEVFESRCARMTPFFFVSTDMCAKGGRRGNPFFGQVTTVKICIMYMCRFGHELPILKIEHF